MEPNIDPQTQALLNTPLQTSQMLSADDAAFLALVMNKIADKTIDLYKPSSLLNQSVFMSLPPEAQSKTETDASNILSAIREIKNLKDAGLDNTYQMQNTVHRVRMTKERLEQVGGDIFIL